ncbi:MAG: single-stranded DNA-binding protein [Blastocatellia bacterium]
MSFNKITIVGYLGRDPELRYTPQGTALCKMSIATTEKRKNVAGEMEEHTTWFRVTAWGRQAELANEYLAKGRQVYIEGRLRLEEYTDREGQKRFSAEVNATEIQFLGQRTEPLNTTAEGAAGADQAEVTGSTHSKQAPKNKRASQEELVGIEEDGIPF